MVNLILKTGLRVRCNNKLIINDLAYKLSNKTGINCKVFDYYINFVRLFPKIFKIYEFGKKNFSAD